VRDRVGITRGGALLHRSVGRLGQFMRELRAERQPRQLASHPAARTPSNAPFLGWVGMNIIEIYRNKQYYQSLYPTYSL